MDKALSVEGREELFDFFNIFDLVFGVVTHGFDSFFDIDFVIEVVDCL
jgi:hypothetical protein